MNCEYLMQSSVITRSAYAILRQADGFIVKGNNPEIPTPPSLKKRRFQCHEAWVVRKQINPRWKTNVFVEQCCYWKTDHFGISDVIACQFKRQIIVTSDYIAVFNCNVNEVATICYLGESATATRWKYVRALKKYNIFSTVQLEILLKYWNVKSAKKRSMAWKIENNKMGVSKNCTTLI